MKRSGTMGLAAAALLGLSAVLPAAAGELPPTGDDTVVPGSRAGTTTVHFVNMPVRSALQLIAEEGHFNLVVSDSVDGTVSLRLVDVTWQQVLDVVLQLKGLRMRVEGGTRTISAGGDR